MKDLIEKNIEEIKESIAILEKIDCENSQEKLKELKELLKLYLEKFKTLL